MTGFDFRGWVAKRPIIGMIHLAPLPGSPRSSAVSGLVDVMERALADASALVEGGCHGIMMEYFGDAPFFPGRVPTHVIAAMTAIACEVKRRFGVPLGINVLRNDGLSALAVAAAAGADFIRVNVLTGARVTDQGVIQGIAHDLIRERALLNVRHIQVMADVDVKHSAPLALRPLEDEVLDLIKRGMADAVIVSGSGTGAPVDMDKLCIVKSVASPIPVFIGSGTTSASIAHLASHADGFIVGSAFKSGGDTARPIDVGRVREMCRLHKNIQERHH